MAIAPDATLAGLVARFTPNKLGESSSSAAITATGAMCGTSPTALAVSGTGSPSSASVQPGALDFGLVACGTTATAKTFTILNSGAQPFDWAATLAAGMASAYTLSAASGTVAGGASVMVTVTPKAIPATSAITPNLYGDSLTVTTTAPGDGPHVLDLRMTAQSAILAQSAASIDFGSVPINTTATSAFTVSNTGNAPATVSYGVSGGTFGVAPQGQVVTGGMGYQATASFSPTAQTTYSGSATMSVADTVLCAPLPSAIALSGKGAVSASLTPTSVDFGAVACGSTADPKSVTLSNHGTSPFSWSASVGTAYYAVSPASGSLPPNKSVQLTITPAAIPSTSSTAPDLYADTLTVTTNPALESPYVASIHMTAQGAILGFAPPSIDFNKVKVGGSANRSFNVTNSGNLPASITMSVTGPADTFAVSPTTGTVSSSLDATATFTPQAPGALNGSVSLATATTLCAPLPAPLTLAGEGHP